MLVLGIETSCDETAAALVEVETRRIVSSQVYSQLAEHAPYGGVVPEIASRAHLERLAPLTARTLENAGVPWSAIDAVATTVGPGLTTALAMGSTFGKTLALALNKPFLAVNHIEAHALTPHLTNPELAFPYLLLLVSGGHCQLVWVENVGRYKLLGTTLDDAVGECFDKVGKLLNLPHPAGPALEELAKRGQPGTVTLPSPKHDNTLDFSFSGLKTAVRDHLHGPNPAPAADIAASFQTIVAEALARKTKLALRQTGAQQVVVAGGVAANQTIRAALRQTCAEQGATFTAPPLNLCTDNAVMIAYAGGLRHLAGLENGNLGTPVRPRWPLEMAPPSA